MKIYRDLGLLLILTLMLVGCERRPDGVLSDSAMADLTVDLKLAEAYCAHDDGYATDSARRVLRQSVMRKHGVSEKQYAATMAYYGANLDKYAKLYEMIDTKMMKRQGKLLAQSAASSGNDESMWPHSKMAMISPLALSPSLSFDMPTDKLESGSRITWSMRTNRDARSHVFLGVDYTDGSSTYVTRSSGNDKHIVMKLQTDSALTVKRIYGSITIDRDEPLPLWMDSIILVKEPFVADEYGMINTQKIYIDPAKKHEAARLAKMRTDSIAKEKSIVPAGMGNRSQSTHSRTNGMGYMLN